ncbi:hypothetical protein BKA62DRAFT_682985 [Auriculariales sp. MPI-PUGE-AT-0066]|nr:hypothetical protein BKA62DRAFT_682985 [Auriculariales sp. MPI-PUGE-AT-0066]
MVSFDLPQFPPEGEPAILLFLERSLFAGFAIVMFTFGIFVTLTLACLYAMLFHPLHGRRHWALIFFILLLFLGSTVFVVTNYIWSQLMWIDARAYPGGPPAFFSEQFGIWINTVSNSALAFNNFLLDALLLSRCLTFWNRRMYIIFVPFCAWIASAVLAVLTIRESATGKNPFTATKYAIPYFATCLGFNVLVTVLIVSRLLYMRKQVSGLGKQHSRVFTSMVALIVDSALPYTLISVFVIFTITYKKNEHITYSSAFAVPLVGGALWIVSMCILLRAALGRGFQPQTEQQAGKVSGLDFWSPSRPVSTMFSPMQAAVLAEQKHYDSNYNKMDEFEMVVPRSHVIRPSGTHSETSSMTLPISPHQTYHLPRRMEGRTSSAMPRSQRDMQSDYELRLAYDIPEEESAKHIR